MKEEDAKEFRKERANELRRLADVLIEEALIRDHSPILGAAAQANSRRLIEKEDKEKEGKSKERKGRGGKEKEAKLEREESWGYSFQGLEFHVIDEDSSRHARPDGAEVVSIELSISLEGPCLDDDDFSNPFSALGVDIVAIGLSSDGNEDLKCAWHLDKHIHEKGDAPTTLAHPMYHFQHGGNNVAQLKSYGKHLILEPPRIAHPPLDAILAVDFILSNYCGTRWNDLRLENAMYRDLVASAQERYWTPYAFSTATICNSLVVNSPWKVLEIWPQMLIGRVIRRSEHAE